MTSPLASQLTQRFFRYLAITSQSDAAATTLPTTPGQLDMARALAQELQTLGLDEIVLDEHATVTAVKKGTVPGAPRIGFITHIDTVDVGLSPDIHPQILRFKGEDLCLNASKDIWLRVEEHPEINAYLDEEIIFSDGTSVLGADNKAAVTVVMTLLENLTAEQQHGDIVVAFVPDEEVGLRGAKALDLKRFDVDFAWTIDCCEKGEIVFENFNAASASIHFTGVTAHPMSAKGVLVNPLLMAMDYISHFDRQQTPEHTEGREGYVWFNGMEAVQGHAHLSASIRDFDKASFERRKQQIADVAKKIAAQYPTAKVEYSISDIYSNISNAIGEDKRAIDLLFEAMTTLGITPKPTPMRGGTDGAALSAKGLLTPNFFTGAHNFHSQFEFLPVKSFEASYQVALQLCLLAAR
ncbi:peptidase T [Phytobacter diazotrophicus]|jgi:tripeptide aminopeptidase|uniref:Peptidase T n=2 Tax=Enterobacteriaceae TaxID=543 RepID=A0ABW1PVR7_9ENTR|nr:MULTISPECIES: peptidase T [Phytobacter]AUU90923.1 peptidase T [Enterobacteriaceae bacterium ENNIH3]AUV09033.1 peptidase T [Enterobacteriaceae bacterium ENNIH2]MDU7130010.1 peptidase T [Enterobacteriaceae bacterium]PTA96239.1 peptidase T [Kluyvera sp. Nf5]PWF50612.1 peptidase T [[Kluyvera] intestini]PXW50624.1 tripeptide aminopeptidase [Grimontella sp. AG753]QIH63687.1 peptidase T [Enterobacteriaceae bacterium A-F18]